MNGLKIPSKRQRSLRLDKNNKTQLHSVYKKPTLNTYIDYKVKELVQFHNLFSVQVTQPGNES